MKQNRRNDFVEELYLKNYYYLYDSVIKFILIDEIEKMHVITFSSTYLPIQYVMAHGYLYSAYNEV